MVHFIAGDVIINTGCSFPELPAVAVIVHSGRQPVKAKATNHYTFLNFPVMTDQKLMMTSTTVTDSIRIYGHCVPFATSDEKNITSFLATTHG